MNLRLSDLDLTDYAAALMIALGVGILVFCICVALAP